MIDESYNSNPASLCAALEKFKNMKCSGSKIVVLGDMEELGEKSRAFHINMKPIIEDSNVDIVFTIGKFMKNLNQVLSSKIEKYHYENISELEEKLSKKVKSGDCIMVKGSHSLQLSSLVKILLEKYMIYNLALYFSNDYSFLYIFKYITFRAGAHLQLLWLFVLF